MSPIDFPYKTSLIPVIIPSFHPDEKLLRLIEALYKGGELGLTVILLDDGSGSQYADIFRKAKDQYGCHLLSHSSNRGKGRALKTAFQYALEQFPDSVGVVTVDGDGQHAVNDVFACMRTLSEHPDHFILGCRSFEGGGVPLKSRFGNRLTCKVLSYTNGMNLSDTQTGLRAIPQSFIKTLLDVPGERYEFEMNMLLACSERHIPVLEVPVQTIYLENNKHSHFRPIVDSLKIYAVFIRYLLSSLSSFLLDISVFAVSVFLLKDLIPVQYILYATALARGCSSLFNYFVNKHLVFRVGWEKRTMLKYYFLSLLQMAVSGLMVSYIYFMSSGVGETIIKILVDTLLFFLSFMIQRNWVFKGAEKIAE